MGLAGGTAAGLPQEIKHRCLEQIQSAAKDARDRWVRVGDLDPGMRVFRAPTGTLGQWYQLQYSVKNRSALLWRVSADQVVSWSWDGNCRPKQKKGRWISNITPEAKPLRFSDRDLKELMTNHPKGVLYIWSPGFVYSAQFLKDFAEVVRKAGGHFQPLIGQHVSVAAARAAAERYGFHEPLRVVDSVELDMRASAAHYPMILVYRDQRLSVTPMFGVMPKDQFARRLASTLKELSR